MTPEQALRVSHLYFQHIHWIDSDVQKARKFSVWHLSWVIFNWYRLGDDRVQQALELAYVDAHERVLKLDRKIALVLFKGDKLYTGDVHGGRRAYAKKHLVAPGNKKYLQSAGEYQK